MSELALKLIEKNIVVKTLFLDLGNCGIINGLPKKLLECTWLKKLNLGIYYYDQTKHKWINSKNTRERNKFLGSDLLLLAGLSQLEYLYLSNCAIIDISFIKNLTQLRSLDLRFNDIQDIRFLHILTKLEHLYLSSNQIKDIKSLQYLNQLQSLELHSNQIRNIEFLQKLTLLQLLDLSSNQIQDIRFLENLVQLKSLDLRSNQVQDIRFLENLVQLHFLDLCSNRIQDISFLQNLTQLQSLDLSDNQIQDISFLKNLTQLKSLDLRSNQIKDISFLQNLTQLQSLDLSDNQIHDIRFLKKLTQLKSLDLRSNQIKDISFLEKMPQLQSLYLSSNQIRDISFLQNLTQLQSLDLSDNQIQDIKPLLALLLIGLKIDLNVNPITNPPIEIVKQSDQAIISYFEQIDKEGKDYIYEAKLTLVGDGGAGKTSLQTRILNKSALLPKQEKRTRGIEITQWSFDNNENKRFIANIWDFGGQDVYFPVHRFFLTENCVFVLLGSTRTAIHNFDYWIPTIYQFGGKSPVILVQNCFDGNEANWNELDIFFSNMEFNVVKPFYRINLPVQNKGLELLEAVIKFQITQLPHIGEAVPKSWVKVRAKLAELSNKQPFISFDKFIEICRETDKENLTNTKMAHILGRFFHDLGIILWFHDKAHLQDWVILQPHWVMNAVYKIIDDDKIQYQKGNILENDFERLWSDNYYKYKQNLLKQLLEIFKIAFPKKSKKTDFILPARLVPIPEEKKENNITNDIRLEYHFNFMPRGIVNQVSADLSRYILEDENVWNNAVIFNQDESQAQVLEDIFNRTIFIKADGIDARGLILTIIKSLDDILEDYKGIKFIKKVPCSCSVCYTLDNPTLFEHDKLKLWLKDSDEVFCNESRSKLSIKQLLYNVGLNKTSQTYVKEDLKNEENERKGDIYNFFGTIEGDIIGVGRNPRNTLKGDTHNKPEAKKEESKEDKLTEDKAVRRWKMVAIWSFLIALLITVPILYIHTNEPEILMTKEEWGKFKGSFINVISSLAFTGGWIYFIYKMLYERFLDPSKETNFRTLWKSKNK